MIDTNKIEGHTPGPWEVEPREGHGLNSSRCIIAPDDGSAPWNIARVFGAAGPGCATPSNAALIAAAPELYAFWLANQWQPIETAPKDGTTIILLIMRSVIEGSWCKDLEMWEILQLPFHGCGCCAENNPKPTHWRPRFIPPKE